MNGIPGQTSGMDRSVGTKPAGAVGSEQRGWEWMMAVMDCVLQSIDALKLVRLRVPKLVGAGEASARIGQSGQDARMRVSGQRLDAGLLTDWHFGGRKPPIIESFQALLTPSLL